MTNPGAVSGKRAALVPATLAVALLLFGSRWASYIGANPLFLTDLLVAAAVWQFCLNRLAQRLHADATEGFGANPILLWATFTYVALRFVAGWSLSVDALRDAAPYFYIVVGIMSANAMRYVSQESRERTAKVLIWALGLHAAWSAVALLAPGFTGSLPSIAPSAQIFAFRGDIDTALIGFYAAIMIARLFGRDKGGLPYALQFVGCWILIFDSASRAGTLSAALACAVAFLSAMRSGSSPVGRRRFGLLLVPTVIVAATVFLPQTFVGQRLAASFGLADGQSQVAAAGTANARTNAWNAVLAYVGENPGARITGIGFGPDFMYESGATVQLIGEVGAEADAAPRSPHNYWIGSYARLGLVGLALLAGVAAVGCAAAWRQINRPKVRDDLGLYTAMLTVGFIPVATLGVVLESPFGAIPWFWAMGVVMAYPRGRRVQLETERRTSHAASRRGDWIAASRSAALD